MDGIEEKQGAHALVEIVAAAPEAVERLAFPQQFFERRSPAQRVQRAIASLRIASGYDIGKQAHLLPPADGVVISRSASSSSRCVSTSSRSRPFSARANCAVSNP